MKPYTGLIPACGVFCGGCPNYTRDKNPCPGASKTDRCQKCPYHLCCVEKGIEHCVECGLFPCRRFKRFATSWQKYGQNFIVNQLLLKEVGPEGFLARWNAKINLG
ncbi:MAG: DUF3795 domain-containing protein [Anaerolineae bacterium]|nr:DUF3795 domain-containing protein [Anaerolineae bacterium]